MLCMPVCVFVKLSKATAVSTSLSEDTTNGSTVCHCVPEQSSYKKNPVLQRKKSIQVTKLILSFGPLEVLETFFQLEKHLYCISVFVFLSGLIRWHALMALSSSEDN